MTHFWVHQEDGIYFESKGTHDHFRPQARRATPERNHNRGRVTSPKQERTPGDKENEVKVSVPVFHSCLIEGMNIAMATRCYTGMVAMDIQFSNYGNHCRMLE